MRAYLNFWDKTKIESADECLIEVKLFTLKTGL